MTRRAFQAAALALLGLTAASGAAQPPSAPPLSLPETPLDSLPDLPTGPAALRGRVVHESAAADVSGIPVILYALAPGAGPGLRGVLTDATGAFEFAAIANDPAIIYLLGARYAGIPFGVRFAFEAGELAREIELPVAETSSDTSAAEVAALELAVERNCADLTLREVYRLENRSRRTLFVPEAERAGREPILRVTPPERASGLRSDVGDNLERDGEALLFWGPLRPGEQQLEFRYELPESGRAFELRRELASGARRVTLIDRPGGPRLVRGDSERERVPPGAALALRVELPEPAPRSERIAALESRIWLELDGAALSVDQQHQLAVDGDEPLRAPGGEPLLCIALPARASDLRFSPETLALGLARDPSGALAVRGPLPPGELELSLHFLLPIDREVPLFSHAMPLDVPLLSVLVADTGIAIETSRLHRRRPIRTPDRSYLHLEGFEIPAGEPVELRLQPLAARRALPTTAAAGIALAAAGVALAYLVAPLRAREAAASKRPPAAASHAAEEREAVLAAIRGIDEDFEIGKLSEADYREMRQALRAEAVSLLRVERAALEQPERAAFEPLERAAPQQACARCDARAAADARYCSQCGAPLVAAAKSTAAADGPPR